MQVRSKTKLDSTKCLTEHFQTHSLHLSPSLSQKGIHTKAHTYQLSNTHNLILTNTTLSKTHTHSLSLSLSLTHTHPLSSTIFHVHSQTFSITFTYIHTHTHTHQHTHTHTHTHANTHAYFMTLTMTKMYVFSSSKSFVIFLNKLIQTQPRLTYSSSKENSIDLIT